MHDWRDIATCLTSSDPNPWMQRYGWHAANCDRCDHESSVTAFCSWTLLELHLHRPDDFPTLLDSQKLTPTAMVGAECSLQTRTAIVSGQCSRLDPNRDLWRPVFATGPEPRSSAPSVRHRTPTPMVLRPVFEIYGYQTGESCETLSNISLDRLQRGPSLQ